MKKFIVMVMASIMSISMASMAFAKEKEVVTYELKDGIEARLENVETGEVQTVTLENCTKTVEIEEIGDEEYTTITAKGVFYIPNDDPKTRGSVSGEEHDRSGGIEANIKITYRTKYDDSLTVEEQKQILITNVSGSWISHDSSIKISNRKKVLIWCSCLSPLVDQNLTKYTTADSFNFDTKFKEYTYVNGYKSKAGAVMEATLTRGTSSEWLFRYDTLENIINDVNYL